MMEGQEQNERSKLDFVQSLIDVLWFSANQAATLVDDGYRSADDLLIGSTMRLRSGHPRKVNCQQQRAEGPILNF